MQERFVLQTGVLDPAALAAAMADPRAGALVAFEGLVRNHHDARAVTGLAYEAFPAMAAAEGNQVLDEAIRRFGVLDARAVHRLGPLRIGDRAIWVGVTAAHRQEAFLACRWIMDRIKEVVPIWKKEAFRDGSSAWVNAGQGSRSATDDPAGLPRYARQVVLPGFGAEGQRTLGASAILVVGAGGLGCPALQYLAAAGVGSITILDGDRVDETNLHRQVLFTTADQGRNKAESAAERLRAMNPHIAVHAVGEAATPDNLPGFLAGKHAVLDCTDSFEAKYAIHDTAWRMGVPIVQAAVHQLDGQVQVFDPHHPDGGCFRCLWPEPPPTGCVGNCAQAGVLGVTPGLLGAYQAAETLKILLDRPDVLRAETLLVDVFGGATQRLRRTARTDCPCRGQSPWPPLANHVLEPGPRAATLRTRATVIDIRETAERTNAPQAILDLPHVPRTEWAGIPSRFPQRPLVLCCSCGTRTRLCVEQLGCPPGILAWTRSITEWLAQATDSP
jgi:sulfur-carrier protein adenylyltransferase/sulfurtransferase